MAQRILIIDDEDHIRQVMRLTLEAAGYEAGEAADGPRGLEAFGDGSTWDAVLLDQKMPGMDGLETLRHIKDRQAGARVIMVTAFASIELAVDAMKLGATDFVRKPMTPEILRNAVTAALAKPLAPSPLAPKPIAPEGGRGGSAACQPAHHERVPILARSHAAEWRRREPWRHPLRRSTPGRPTSGDGRGARRRGHRARRTRDAASPSSREHVLVLAGRTSPECVSLERRESTAWREVDDRGESHRSRDVADGYALGKPGLGAVTK